MQNSERICIDRAKVAISVRQLIPQDLRRNKYSLEYLFRERTLGQGKDHRREIPSWNRTNG